MKRYGNSKIVQSDVKSDGFASDKEFNRLVVNSLSEVDQETLDHEVIIFNKEDDKIYTYNAGSELWKSYDNFSVNSPAKLVDLPICYIDDIQDTYNQINLLGNINNYLLVDSNLFDFGPIGSPDNFVIDFWLDGEEDIINPGTILYNGLNTGQVDLEENKNLLITTSGSVLIKDPNFQADPTIQLNPADNGYLNVYRPRLKSISPIIGNQLTHIAMIRSGATTYLAINGKINASAPSVEYFHYDPVKIGSGYVGGFYGKLINLRISKGTDLGWTTDFIPPNYNPEVDVNTVFLMDSTSLVDVTSNHTVTVVGTPPIISQDIFYYQLSYLLHHEVLIKTDLVQSSLKFRLPNESISIYIQPNVDQIFDFECGNGVVDVNGYNFYKVRCFDYTLIRKINNLVFVSDSLVFPKLGSNRFRGQNVYDTRKQYVQYSYINTDANIFYVPRNAALRAINSTEKLQLSPATIDLPFKNSPRPFKVTEQFDAGGSFYCYGYSTFVDMIFYIPSGWNTTKQILGYPIAMQSQLGIGINSTLDLTLYYRNTSNSWSISNNFSCKFSVDTWYYFSMRFYGGGNIHWIRRNLKTGVVDSLDYGIGFHSSYAYLYGYIYPSDILFNFIRYSYYTGDYYNFTELKQSMLNHEYVYNEVLL